MTIESYRQKLKDEFHEWCHGESVVIRLERIHLSSIVAMLQLALRHPGVKGMAPAKIARAFVEEVIDRVETENHYAAEAIRTGDRPEWDEPIEE